MTGAFEFGEYALFIWLSYGIAAAVLGALIVASVIGLRRAEKTASELEARRGPGRDRPQAARARLERQSESNA